jgi:hypothetical protein
MEKEEEGGESDENGKEERRTERRVSGEDEEARTPICEEVGNCIQKTKNNKRPGENGIIAELIKYGGEGIIEPLHKSITMI